MGKFPLLLAALIEDDLIAAPKGTYDQIRR
jgi:hypothetical protein